MSKHASLPQVFYADGRQPAWRDAEDDASDDWTGPLPADVIAAIGLDPLAPDEGPPVRKSVGLRMTLRKALSKELQERVAAGRAHWVTVKEGPLEGRHLLIDGPRPAAGHASQGKILAGHGIPPHVIEKISGATQAADVPHERHHPLAQHIAATGRDVTVHHHPEGIRVQTGDDFRTTRGKFGPEPAPGHLKTAGVTPPDAHGMPWVFLESSFGDKDRLKALGARWDSTRRRWAVPANALPQVAKQFHLTVEPDVARVFEGELDLDPSALQGAIRHTHHEGGAGRAPDGPPAPKLPTPEAASPGVTALVAAGGRRWQKNGKDRVYLPEAALATALGLRTTHYGTGNISSATMNGERIANGRARDILSALAGAKFWYDVDSDQFHWATEWRHHEEILKRFGPDIESALRGRMEDAPVRKSLALAFTIRKGFRTTGYGEGRAPSKTPDAGKTRHQLAAIDGDTTEESLPTVTMYGFTPNTVWALLHARGYHPRVRDGVARLPHQTRVSVDDAGRVTFQGPRAAQYAAWLRGQLDDMVDWAGQVDGKQTVSAVQSHGGHFS